MELHTDDLKRLARLARIAVSDNDVTLLQSQLNGIFGLIDELQAVDTRGIEPLSHPLDVVQPMAQRLREDRVTETDQRSANLANAPAQENGLFLVPKVLE
ncbi:MAG: Asp-tRNA(Asn)/Glu-tRNA(Gln) amidotransferase subunit GatC [Betaproteobacteria bacterium]|nr:Asp-tRNA(Asn)/Glu-tRNA(Gln) amidotransferase subunit GatC [Betaproteobacteria bacterium]